MENPPKCPRCSSDEVLPIAYGLPSPEMVEESMAGRVALGGCVVVPDAPDYTCQSCGNEWHAEEAGT